MLGGPCFESAPIRSFLRFVRRPKTSSAEIGDVGRYRTNYERKRAQGKTTKEALRCLKRRISDRIFVTLRASVLT